MQRTVVALRLTGYGIMGPGAVAFLVLRRA